MPYLFILPNSCYEFPHADTSDMVRGFCSKIFIGVPASERLNFISTSFFSHIGKRSNMCEVPCLDMREIILRSPYDEYWKTGGLVDSM
jgi:hypothetical protein